MNTHILLKNKNLKLVHKSWNRGLQFLNTIQSQLQNLFAGQKYVHHYSKKRVQIQGFLRTYLHILVKLETNILIKKIYALVSHSLQRFIHMVLMYFRSKYGNLRHFFSD